MKNSRIFLLFAFFLLINFASASCNSSQININTASAEELDKIVNVGPVIASRIIENRTYNSLDDLLRVKGIGDITLNEIKEQGLACVSEESSSDDEETAEKTEEISEEEEEAVKSYDEEDNENYSSSSIINFTYTENSEDLKTPEVSNLTPIRLNSKVSQNIKSRDNKEILGRNLSFYGIISFCVIFGAWFLLNRKKRRNEFRQ